MKNFFQSSTAVFLVAIVVAVFLGLFTVAFASIFGEKLSLLLALPAVMIIGLIFLYDRYLLFTLILLLRPSLDPILDKTKIGGFGVGGVLNALIIIIALIAVFNKEFQFRSFLIKTWAPFLFVLMLAVGYAPDFTHAIKSYLSLMSNAAMFALALALVKTQADYGRWMRIVLLSSLIPVFYGFIDYAMGGKFYGDAGIRVASTFTHPNILAFYLVLIITLSFYFIKSKVIYISPAVKWVLPLYIIIMIALLLLTKTRSAWIACTAFFVLYGLLYERKYLFFVLLSPVIALLIPEVRDRILDLTQGNEIVTAEVALNSYAWRKYLWESGLNWMQPMHYFFGYGVESFMSYSTDFFPLSMGRDTPAHSVYVQLIFETGVIGLLTFVWLYSSLAYHLAKFYKANQVMIFAMIMLIFQYAVIASSDNMLSYLAYNWYFWFVLGASYSIMFHENKDIAAETTK